MNGIAIVTDSNSGIRPDETRALGVHVLPMPLTIDGREYLEGVDLEPGFFFEKQAQAAAITTSQPAPGDLLRLWEGLLEDHQGVLHIPMSSALSSSYATACSLAEDFDGRVQVADARRISVPLWQTIQDVLKLRERGASLDELRRRVEEKACASVVYLAVNTLEFLKRGGRITPAAAAVGTVLGLKPVLQIREGKVDAFSKARGMKAACEKMFQAIQRCLEEEFAGRPVKVFAAYSGEEALGEEWRQQVQERFPAFPVHCAPLTLSICCHTGPGALGVACVEYEP